MAVTQSPSWWGFYALNICKAISEKSFCIGSWHLEAKIWNKKFKIIIFWVFYKHALTDLIIPNSQDVARDAGCFVAFYSMYGRMDGGISVLHCSYFSKISLGLIVIIVITLVVIRKELGILRNCLPYKMRIIFYCSPAYRTAKNSACKNFSFVLHFSGISYSIS